jgi:hypothetical protein
MCDQSDSTEPPAEARDALWSMRRAGLIYENGRHQWLVVGDV